MKLPAETQELTARSSVHLEMEKQKDKAASALTNLSKSSSRAKLATGYHSPEISGHVSNLNSMIQHCVKHI